MTHIYSLDMWAIVTTFIPLEFKTYIVHDRQAGAHFISHITVRRRHKQYSCLGARKESYPFKLSTAYSKHSVGVVLTANYYQCFHNGTDPSQLVSTRGHHKASLRLMNECLETRTVAQTDRRAVKLMTLFHTRHSSIRRVVITPRVCKVGENCVLLATYWRFHKCR